MKPHKSGYNPREKERILDRLNEVIEKHPDYVECFDSQIRPRMEQAKKKNLTTPEVINMITEAAYFESKIGKKRIAELAVGTLRKNDPDREVLTKIVKESCYEWIEVKGVVLGERIVAVSLWDGRELTIYEQSGTYQARVGTLLATRLIPCESDWQMTGHATLLPEQIGYQYKRTKELGVTPPPLTQTEHVDALIGYGKKNKVEEEMEEEVAQANAKINPNMRPGPDETMLTTQMLSEAAKLDLPPVKRVRDEIINEFCESWLDSPQKELGNMTPREMILSERRERGNPIKKIKYEIETRYGGDPRDEIYNEGLWHQQQGQFWEALWFYAQIVNYAKELPEPHRFYANVAASLAYLTCYKEARLLFEKALQLEPDYELAAKNLQSINDQKILEVEVPRNTFYLWQSTWKKWGNLPTPQQAGANQIYEGLRWYLNLVAAHEITLKPKTDNLSATAIARIADGVGLTSGLPVAPHVLVVLAQNLHLTRWDKKRRVVELSTKGKNWKTIDRGRWAQVITTWLSTYVPTGEQEGDRLINPAAHVLPYLAARPDKERWSLEELLDILKQNYKMNKEARMMHTHMILIPELTAFGIVKLGDKIKEIIITDYGRRLLAEMSTEAKRQIPSNVWDLTKRT